jgi:hypothetical protein
MGAEVSLDPVLRQLNSVKQALFLSVFIRWYIFVIALSCADSRKD